jgi:hypothetical protein
MSASPARSCADLGPQARQHSRACSLLWVANARRAADMRGSLGLPDAVIAAPDRVICTRPFAPSTQLSGSGSCDERVFRASAPWSADRFAAAAAASRTDVPTWWALIFVYTQDRLCWEKSPAVIGLHDSRVLRSMASIRHWRPRLVRAVARHLPGAASRCRKAERSRST